MKRCLMVNSLIYYLFSSFIYLSLPQYSKGSILELPVFASVGDACESFLGLSSFLSSV